MKLVRQQVSKTEASQAINRVASTEDGKILLAYLCAQCGFFNNLMDPSDPNKTQVLAAKRGVYGAVRQAINPQHLLQAEYGITIINDQPKKVSKNDRDSDK